MIKGKTRKEIEVWLSCLIENEDDCCVTAYRKNDISKDKNPVFQNFIAREMVCATLHCYNNPYSKPFAAFVDAFMRG
jgi:hypothetical protein